MPTLSLRARLINDGQRIDEQAHDVLGPADLRRPTGDRRTETDRALAGVTTQQLGPSALYQRVQRDALAPRKGLQVCRQVGREQQVQRAMAGGTTGCRPPNASARKLCSSNSARADRQNDADELAVLPLRPDAM